MLVALIIAVIVGIVVKIALSALDATRPYADIAAVLVALLVFLSRSGIF